MPEHSATHDNIPTPIPPASPPTGRAVDRSAASAEFAPPREFWKLILLEGCGLVLLGILALLLPTIASLAIGLLTGWLLLIAGLFRFASIFSARGGPGYLGSMLLAAITAGIGAVLVVYPVDGVLTLTLAFAIYLCAHGIASLSVAAEMRGSTHQWFWIAIGAVADFVLAGLVIAGWPASASIVLGIYAGINLTVAGVALILAAAGGRSAHTETSSYQA